MLATSRNLTTSPRVLLGTVIRSLLVVALLSATMVLGSADPAQAVTPFTSVFSTNAPGNITFVSNTLVTCSESSGTNANRCVSNGQNGNWANNNFTMRRVDVDSDPTTNNSSSNDLMLAPDATVLYAGLFWVGYADNANTFDPGIKIATPASAGYIDLVASSIDNQGSRHYGAFVDVTTLVQAGGSGTYTVGGADLDASGSGRYGGWSLVIAYQDNNEPWRNLNIFNGYDFVSRDNGYNVPLTVSGFNAPPVGPVTAQVGVQTGEGDARYRGPSTKVNGTTLSDAMNPADNTQNSTISILGTPANTLANPSYPNQLGFDADIIDASGLIPAGATSANLQFESRGDIYGINVITTAIDIYVPNLTSSLRKQGTDLNGEQVHPGDVIEYRIQFDNTGEDPATGVVIADAVPAGTTYVPGSLRTYQDSSATGPMSDDPGDDNAFFDAGANAVIFHVGDGATPSAGGEVRPLSQGGQVHEVAFQVRVDAGTESTTITNEATVDYVAKFLNESYSAVTNPVEHDVLALVDLSITKSDDADPVTAGGTIVYTLGVANAGPSTAESVVIVDTLADGMSFVSGAGCTAAGATLTCDAGDIGAADTYELDVTVVVDGTYVGSSVTNVAEVSSATHEHELGNNATKEPTEVARSADIGVVKSAPITVDAGTNLTYTVEVSNAGPSDALDVVMVDPVPSGVTLVSASADLGGTCDSSVECTWPSLPSGATSTVTIVVAVPGSTADGTVVTNSVKAASSDPDPNGSNNTDQVTTTVGQAADLFVTKAAPATAIAGDQVVYTLEIGNDGPSDAVDATITDPVPSGDFTFNAVSSSSGCSVAASVVICEAGTLPAGKSVGFTVVFDIASSVADGTIVLNQATGQSATTDTNATNDVASASTRIDREADLAIRKDDNTTVAIGGATLSYSLDYRNAGASDASAVVLVDTLPDGVVYLAGSSDPACSESSGVVTCSVGAVAAGTGGSVAIVVDVDPAIVDGTALLNQASISAAEADPNTLNNTTEVKTPAERSAELQLTKTDDVDPAIAGEDITYSLRVRNIGPSTDTNVVVTDTLPAGVSLLTLDPRCTESGGLITCAAGTLTPGQATSFGLTVRTSASLADGTILSNAASAQGDVAALVEITEETTVNTSADLRLDKDAPANVVAGNTMTYTVTVINDGPSDAANVRVTDALPTGTSYQAHTVTTGSATCSATASNLSCEQTTLAPGASMIIEATVLVDERVLDGATISNTAVVKSDTADPGTGNNTASASTDVDRSIDLRITKSSITPSVVAGEQATWSIVVTNAGLSQATNVQVTDVLPDGFTFNPTASSDGCADGVTCTVPVPLHAGESFVFTVVADVGASVADGTWTNEATVSATEPESNPDNNLASADVEVVTEADVSILKLSDTLTFTPGTDASYTVTLANAGPSDARNVVVADLLPAGLTFDADASSAPCAEGVTCTLPTLAAGDSVSLTIAVGVASSSTDTITNEATVAADTFDPHPSDNRDSDPTPVIPEADLGVTKTAPAQVTAGESLTYAITVSNAGPSDASDVVATDPLPEGLTVVSLDPRCSESLGTVACTAADLPAGDTVEYSIVVGVPADAADDSILMNQVDVTSTADDPNLANNTAAVETTVQRMANLIVAKSASVPTGVAGTSVSFTVTVVNEGPSSAAAVSVVDTLPSGLTATSATTSAGSCFSTGGSVSCSHPDLGPGASMVITISAEIDSGVADGELRTNTAAATTVTAEASTADNSGQASITVTTAADLRIDKVASEATVIAGEAVSYTLTVTNDGPSSARNVAITDALPPGLVVEDASPLPACSIADSLVQCDAGTIDVGDTFEVTIDATLSSDSIDGDTITNTATVTSDTSDPDADNNSATEPILVNTAADLSLTKTSTVGQVSGGETVFYNLVAANAGPSRASGVVVTDTLPADVTFNAALSNSTCAESAGELTCSFPGVQAGEQLAFVVAVDVPASFADTELTNTAMVTAAEDDPNALNNIAQDILDVQNHADLSVVKDADDLAVAGEAIGWSLDIGNVGPADATSVTVTDTLPAGATFNSGGSDSRCSASAGTVTCAVATLAAGDSDRFNVLVDVASSVAAQEVLVNSASVASATADPQPANNTSTDTVPVERNSELSIVKADLNDPVTAGQTAQWSITVSNAGPSDADNVTIVDTLPPGFTPTAVDDTTHCSVVDQTVACTFDTLPDGQDVSVVVSAAVSPGLADGSTLQNTAVATSDSSESVSDTEDTTVVRSSDLGLAKTSDGEVVAGTTQTYTLTVDNAGPSDADGVVVTDALPAGVTFVSDSRDGCVAVSSVVTCNMGALAAGDSITFDLVVDVADSAPNPTINVATVSSDSPDPVSGNDIDDDEVDITYAADLSIDKTASPAPAVPGETIAWTIDVANAGPSIATAVEVVDPLPSGVSFVSASPGCAVANEVVTCGAASLGVGQQQSFTIVGHLDPGLTGSVVNGATVSSAISDPDASDNQASVSTSLSPSADVGLVKTATPDPVTAGEDVTYTLTITNDGPSEAAGVTVVDALPDALTPLLMTPLGDCSIDGQNATCTTPSLGVGDTYEVTLVATVSEITPDGSVVTNSATVSALTNDPAPANNTDAVSVDIEKSANLAVTKVANVSEVSAGERLIYGITVSNDGPSSATGIVVTDTLPDDVVFDATLSSNACSEAAGEVTCTFPLLASGSSLTFTVVVDLPSELPDDALVANTVAVVGAENDPDPADNADTHTITLANRADVSVVKDANGTATAGEPFAWGILVRNSGPADATDVTISDALPVGTTFDPASSDPRCSALLIVVTCSLGTLAAAGDDTVTIGIQVASGMADGATIENTATVASTIADPVALNNQSTDAVPTQRSAALTISKSDVSDPVVAGESAAWAITVFNAGPSDADNVVISDTLPAGFTPTAVDDSTNCALVLDAVNCSFASLADGESVTVVVDADVSAALADGTTLFNTANIASDNSSAVSDTESTTAVRQSDVSVTKVSAAEVTAGTTHEYTIAVTNDGPSDADNVVVTDILPVGLTFVSDSLGVCVAGTGVVTCDLGTLANQQVQSFSLVVYVDDTAGEMATNIVIVDSDSADPTPGNNSAEDNTDVVFDADLSLAKSADVESAVAGETITWALEASNAGPSLATDVAVVDTLPLGITFQSATGPCVHVDGTVTCSVAALAANGTASFSIIGLVDPAYTGDIVNTASVASATPDSDAANDDAVATTPTVAAADVSVTKDILTDPLVAGSPATFELTVSNEGPSDALDVTVSDVLADDLTFAGASPECLLLGSTVTCSADRLPAGETMVFEIATTVDSSVADGTTLTNTAVVATTTEDANAANDQDTASAVVTRVSELYVTKVALTEDVVAGQPIVYEITVENLGASDADNVIATDILPDGLDFLLAASANCSATDNVVTCTTPTLAAGDSVTFGFTALVDPSFVDGATVLNTVTVVSDSSAPASGSDESPSDAQSVLEVAKTLETKDPVIGADVAWNIVVTNTGPSTARNVVAVDEVPPGFTDVQVSGDTCSADGTVVSCQVDELAVGERWEFEVQATAENEAAGSQTNTVDVTSDSSVAVAGSVDFNVRTPNVDMTISKVAQSQFGLEGDTIAWLIEIRNDGEPTANPAALTDAVPGSLQVVSVSSTDTDCSSLDNTVSCTLAAGFSGVAQVTVVTRVLDAGSDITNTATLTMADGPVMASTDVQGVATRRVIPEPSGEGLAFTGSEVLPIVLWALGFLAAGVTLVGLSRRRDGAAQ